MNKTELRQSYIDKGYEVEKVATWDKVSEVEGLVKYDVNVVDPNDQFYTAQVVVENDGTAEEIAEPAGQWKSTPATFRDELEAFLRDREDNVNGVYVIVRKEVYAQDAAAVVDVYQTDTGGVSVTPYVVKKRNNVFDFKKIV